MRSPESRGLFSSLVVGVAGAAAMGGTLLPWAVVRYNPRFIGVELSTSQQTRHVAGVDLTLGTGVMIAGIAVCLVVILAMLLARPRFLVAAAVGSLVFIGLAALQLARLKTDVLHGSRDPYSRNPNLGDRKLGRLFEVSPDIGLFLALVGGVIALVAVVVAIRRSRPA